MARIRCQWRGDTLHVTVTGRLTITDMGRLEHACGPALVTHPLKLELNLKGVELVDRIGSTIVDHLAARGARIHRRLTDSPHIRLVPPGTQGFAARRQRISARRAEPNGS
jgi:hypothetical protein